ncbi:hypothetical protein H0H93_011062, partial [Arthromyces matolae]
SKADDPPVFEQGVKLGSLTVDITVVIDSHGGTAPIVMFENENTQSDIFLHLQRDLQNYRGDALVYILESDLSNDEWDSVTKQEIHDILDLSEISSVPILILALSQTGSETVEDVARKFDLQGINLQGLSLSDVNPHLCLALWLRFVCIEHQPSSSRHPGIAARAVNEAEFDDK